MPLDPESRLAEALERCPVCLNDWHRRNLEVYLTGTTALPLVFRVRCEECGAKTAWCGDAADAVAEWNAAHDKAELMRNPTPEFWARLYGGD